MRDAGEGEEQERARERAFSLLSLAFSTMLALRAAPSLSAAARSTK